MNSRWSWLAETMPLLIAGACFGPYLSQRLGVRIEHFLIYLFFPVAQVALFTRPHPLARFWPVVLARFNVLFITVWSLGVTFLGARQYHTVAAVIGRAQNDGQAFAVLTIMIAFLGSLGVERITLLFRRTCWLILGLLIVNSGIAFMGAALNKVPDFIVKYWQPPGISVWVIDSLMSLSLGNGRFLGIFSQPVESGVMYTLGLLLLGYLTRHKRQFSVTDYAILLALCVGGILSVSKVFILGAPVVFLVYQRLTGGVGRVVNWRLAVIGLGSLFVATALFIHWTGKDYFLRLFQISSGTDLLNLLTAGRFQAGGEGVMKRLFEQVWSHAPMTGLGYDVVMNSDNAWMAVFLQGGVVGVMFYSLILWAIGISCWHAYRLRIAEGPLLVGLLLLILGGGLGAPVLTLNRCGTVLWIVLGFVWVLIYAKQAQQHQTSTAPLPGPQAAPARTHW